MEFSGPVLPSANRELISVVSSAVLNDEHNDRDTREREKLLIGVAPEAEESLNSSEPSMGTHGFVLELTPHDGDEKKKTNSDYGNSRNVNISVGDTTSAWFNGGKNNECTKGDVFTRAIWDCKTPMDVIFVEEMASLALGIAL